MQVRNGGQVTEVEESFAELVAERDRLRVEVAIYRAAFGSVIATVDHARRQIPA